MSKRIHIESTQRGLRRIRKVMSDPKTRIELAKAGAVPLTKSMNLTTPVGSRDQRRYAKRVRKGRRNRPSTVTHITKRGNLKASQTVVPTSYGVDVGPRVKPGSGNYAVYAPYVHAVNPWLSKAAKRAKRAGQMIMSNRVKRMIQRFDL